jgi:hypothetical protein
LYDLFVRFVFGLVLRRLAATYTTHLYVAVNRCTFLPLPQPANVYVR